MTFMVYHGLHGAVAEGFDTAREALGRWDELERGGAKYIQVVDPAGRDLSREEIDRLAAGPEATNGPRR